MARRSKKMEPVERLAGMREEAALKQLGEALQAVEREESRLAQLEDFQREYRQRMQDAGRAGLSGESMRGYVRFTEQLGELIVTQGEQIRQARGRLDLARANWQHHHGRHKAVTALIERFRAREAREADRREQKDSDELVSQRAAREAQSGD